MTIARGRPGGRPGRARSGTVGSRYTHVWEVCAYVDRHLGDPELGPDIIAAGHNMSVRSLHKLFEGEGIAVNRLIQHRRLQECARDLARGDSGERTTSGMARRWGFTRAAHFSRLFRDAYGMTPNQWPEVLADPSEAETFRQRQATPRGGVASRHGPSPASACECGQ